MPITSYPRPGHPIAPSVLRPYLNVASPISGKRLCDLDDKIWQATPGVAVEELGRAVVKRLLLKLQQIKQEMGATPVGRSDRLLLVDDLELEIRTYNCLSKTEIDQRSGGLNALTIGQALRLRCFGVKSLVDLLTSIEGASLSGREIDRKRTSRRRIRRSRTVPHDLRRFADGGTVPKKFRDLLLPPIQSGLRLTDLGLRNRTVNALRCEGYGNKPERLGKLTVADALQFRGIGLNSLLDLVEVLHRWAKLRTRVEEVTADATAPTVQSIARFKRAMRHIRSITVEDELLEVLVPTRIARDTQIVIARFGLWGKPRRTLESVAHGFGLTRERVRQICSPPWLRDLPEPRFAPALQIALTVVRNKLPALASDIELILSDVGITSWGTTLESLIEIARVFKRRPGFSVDVSGAVRIAVRPSEVNTVTTVRTLVKKLVSRFGAATVSGVLAKLEESGRTPVARDLAEVAISSCPDCCWLDRDAGWFTVFGGYNSLYERVRKVFAVTATISITELRTAVRRDYRMGSRTPPLQPFREFCKQMPNCHTDGDYAYCSKPDALSAVLSADETTIVRLLRDYGPVCERIRLQRLANEAGVSEASFWRCLQYSPAICRYARSVYGLVGAPAPLGLIESLIPERRAEGGVLDHGWTDDGRVWIMYSLSQSAIMSGILGVPAAKREFIQGDFRLFDGDSKRIGKLTVKESSAWGVKRLFQDAGTEAGDHLMLEFCPTEKVAVAHIGDESLIDDKEPG